MQLDRVAGARLTHLTTEKRGKMKEIANGCNTWVAHELHCSDLPLPFFAFLPSSSPSSIEERSLSSFAHSIDLFVGKEASDTRTWGTHDHSVVLGLFMEVVR